jgi:type I restriction enzyme, R subunit
VSYEHDEFELELATFTLLGKLGWATADATGETFPGGMLGREHPGEVVLRDRLDLAVSRLNPDVPGEALADAVEQLVRLRPRGVEVRNNRDVWNLLRNGQKVEVQLDDGSKRSETVRFVDWDDPSQNDWLAVRQYTVTGDLYKTRADIVGFVNGIPWCSWS